MDNLFGSASTSSNYLKKQNGGRKIEVGKNNIWDSESVKRRRHDEMQRKPRASSDSDRNKLFQLPSPKARKAIEVEDDESERENEGPTKRFKVDDFPAPARASNRLQLHITSVSRTRSTTARQKVVQFGIVNFQFGTSPIDLKLEMRLTVVPKRVESTLEILQHGNLLGDLAFAVHTMMAMEYCLETLDYVIKLKSRKSSSYCGTSATHFSFRLDVPAGKMPIIQNYAIEILNALAEAVPNPSDKSINGQAAQQTQHQRV
ncbi:uncharacterized protein V1518DRAFT_287062 [Limtongia smithiae]|uniref:uncharacterized protein n=1 Tax=Limtongia smithiae TaxID=1125753 RepID=UPI0034CE4341